MMKRYQIKRFQLLWILLLFAFQFSKATNCTCPNNVVQNPSFENGITNWTYFNGNFSANTYAAQCGTYAGHFQHTSGNGGFYQDLTNVAVGSKLTISFYGGVHDNSFNQRFGLFYLNSAGVQIGGDSVNVDGPLPNMSFYTIISTVPSGTTKVRIMGKASGNWLKVDQICLNVEQPCVNFTALAQSDLNLVKTRSWTNQITCGSEPERIFYADCLLDNISGGTGGNRKLWKVVSAGTFKEYCDGTAYAEVQVQNVDLPTYKFNITLILSGRTFTAPAGSPHLEGCTSSSKTNWYYYTSLKGSFVGLESLAGGVLAVTGKMAAFQMGTNASLYGVLGNFGASSWMDYAIICQPNGFNLKPDCQFDFNFFLSGGDLLASDASNCGKICVGQSTNLNGYAVGGKPAYTYSWSHGLGTGQTKSVSPATTTTYTVTATDANGCTATDAVMIMVNPAPTVDAGANQILCPGKCTDLTATASGGTSPYTYTWDKGLGTGQTKNVCPSVTTTYTVTVTDAKGCTATDAVTVTVNPNILVTITKIDAKCGILNGSATANPTGGTQPYTYKWSNGPTTQINSNIGPGTYTVTVTDSKGCTATASTAIINIGGPSLDAGADKSICIGSNANLTANATGGTTPYTYVWDNGLGTGQNKTVSPTVTTTYSVTVTDANGCTAADQVKVIVFPNPMVTINKNDAKCGFSNGSATANPSGGTSPYTYNWSNGGTTQSISNLSTGNYIVTVTDSKGCTATASTTINNISGPTVNAGSDKSGCVGSTFNLSATANGGTSPYTYAWDNGLGNGQNKTVNPGFTTTYTVTVTDANGCTAVDQVKVIIYPNPSVSIDKWHAKCGFANGSATANASGGTSPYTYNWSNGGTTQSISNLSAGNYSVTVTDSKGCTATASTTINNTNGPTVDAGSDKSGCVGSTFNLSATANGGTSPYTYAWDNGLGNGQNKTVNPGFTTTYTVTVTDANGCTAVDQVKVIIYPNPSVSIDKWHAKCGFANGSATANASGGTSPYTYNWSNGGTTQSISNLSAGNYSVTVTDSKGCTATASTTINNTSGPTVDAGADKSGCVGSTFNLSATANGGTSPYTYAWDNGLGNGQNKTVNPGFTTTYTVTVTDANGCTAVDQVKVIIYPNPSVSIDKWHAKCGFANGSATANASGGTSPYTYNWSNGGTTQSISNLSAGNYSVTVTDSKGCTATASTTINNTNGPTVDAGADKSGCVGSTFNLSATANGGTSPYTYAWDNGLGNGQNKTVNPGFTTTYTVTVTDANGCTAVDQVKVIIYPNPSVSIDKWNAKCGFANGSATANASGGTSPYTYNWSNGGTTQSISNLSAGNYSVTVTDSKGCTATASTTINNTSGPTVDAGADKSGCVGSTFNLSATANGGTSPYTYAWDNGLGNGQNKTVNPGFTTTYTVTVTDANGCTAVDQVKVIIYPNPSVSIDKWHAKCGYANGSATANASGGTSPYTYNWSNGGTTQSISNLSAGNYSVTVTDSKGCTATASTTINNTSGPTVDAGADKSGCVGSTFNLSATANGGTSPYTYAWDNGLGNGQNKTVNPGFTTTYTVTVTDANGCTAVDQVKVIIYPNPSVSIDKWHAKCGFANGSATANASGGTSPYTYNWSNGGTTQSISNLSAGNYSVTVTDSKGCTATASTTINNTNGPTVDAGADKSGCVGSTFNLSATANGGTSPYTYAWDNGLGNGQSKTVNPGFTTTYTVTVTDANGCTAVDQVKVIIYPNPSVSIDKWHAKCGYANGSATANASGGTSPYTYNWSNGGTTQSISNLSAGNYSVTVTDSKGCTATASTSINNTNGPTVDAGADKSGCVGSTFNLSATANGGTSPYTYAWDNGLGNGQNKTVNPGFTTTYTVTVTDANGCTAVDQVKVIIYPNPSVSIDKWHAKCGYANGSATANASGGTSPYTYNWSNGGTTQSISNLSAGNYSVTITDSKGCTATASTTINNTNGPTVDAGADKSGCVGSTFNLSATANGGTSPYTYAWDNGLGNGQNKTVNPGFTTTYTVTVTDANGCTAVDQVKVIIYPNPSVSIDKWHAKCGYANGSATANASGGTSPYTYNWSNGGTTQSISNLSAGNYSVTVTDSKGCIATASTTINNTNGPTVDAGSDKSGCVGSTFNLIATANGGTSPYTYAWDNGLGNGQNKTVNPGFTTTYTVTVTDANGCTAVDQVKVIIYPNPSVSIDKWHAKCGYANGSATANASGGTSPYTYNWSNGGTTQSISNLSAGNYSVTVTDSKGCTATANTTIKQLDGPTVDAGIDQETCKGQLVYLNASANGGTSPYTYAWDNGLGNGQSKTVNPAFTSTYTVTVTDANGCTATDKVKITILDCSPKITHEKTLASITKVGLNTYNVVYHILVKNTGYAGVYDLSDKSGFDDDIAINTVSYSSNAPGNPGNVLFGSGPWKLADNQAIFANTNHLYVISFNVKIDLSATSGGNNTYYSCGRSLVNRPSAGEALFNESLLDLNDDGYYEERDTACGDLPYLEHTKTLSKLVQTGPRNFQVSYNIVVVNKGGKADNYALADRPAFDNDITILGARYNTDAPSHPANPGSINLAGTGPWNLSSGQNINPGAVHTYTIQVDVSINLEDGKGDNRYDQCGRAQFSYPVSNEGLFNESQLDISSDGTVDQKDTACADVPYIVHEKFTQNVIDRGNGDYGVIYKIDVKNLGGASGRYNLVDAPGFDNDFVIQSANYTTNAIGNIGNPNPVNLIGSGPWTLATNQNINAFSSQQYYLTVNAIIDLVVTESQGDEVYSACGSKIQGTPSSGEGLFNQSTLDVNVDGVIDQRDTTCYDIQFNLCSLGDFVWHDKNVNGKQDFGEEGIEGVPVYLYDAITNTVVRTTTTNQYGYYLFDKIQCGKFYVKFVPNGTWTVTTPNAVSDVLDSDVDNSNGPGTTAMTFLSPGEDDRTWDLGLYKCSMMGGRVFFDTDKDGVFDATENGINGLDVFLMDATSGVSIAKTRTTTNPSTPSDDGFYMFNCIKPGTYYVLFERLDQLASSVAYQGGSYDKDSDISHENGLNTTKKISVQSGDKILNIGAGFMIKATVGDYAWIDANANGIQDGGEKPAAGMKVYAYSTSGTMVSEAVTESNGHYMLDGIGQGDYYVKFVPLPGYGFTQAHKGPETIDNDVDGANGYGTTRVYRLQSGDAVPNIDAGLTSQALPIEWLTFDAYFNGKGTELNWTTGIELNNDYYSIERKHESEREFATIGQIGADVNTSAAAHEYDYLDNGVSKSGIYYYRVKQVDKDGVYNYSKVVSVKVSVNKNLGVVIYPNPVNELLKVEYWISGDTEVEVTIFDQGGKNVGTNPFGGFRKSGQYVEAINTSNLAPGQYSLQIKTTNGLVNKRFSVSR